MKFYKHFTEDERVRLQFFLCEKRSLRNIAQCMGKNVSSISREIKRNTDMGGEYGFRTATELYCQRRQRSVRTTRLKDDNKLILFVKKCLDKFWSPEIIADRWKQRGSDRRLSHTTIYQAIKNNYFPEYSPQKHFRRHGKRLGIRSHYNTIKPDNLIVNWEDCIVNRERFGDWEGDTLCGRPGHGGLVTFVDRKSRYLTASIVRTRNSEETKEAIFKALCGYQVKSISLDNGSEFAKHEELHKKYGVAIYFADLHSPWQRGSNENINGLLRFFFPKGCSFLEITQERVNEVLALVNNRPRKCLG